MTTLFNNPYLATLMLILGFGFLIFVHELGHFLVAKWVGIRATQFAVGFGQALVSYRKGIGLKLGSTEPQYRRRTEARLQEVGVDPTRVDEKRFYETADALGLGETEYRLNWVPLGGYVKMLGQEDMDPSAQSDDPRAFNRKPIWARACVISAGVIVNLLVGLLFLIVAFSDFAGVEFPAPRVGFAEPGMPAATTYAQNHDNDPAYLGLQPGDHILEVNGKPIDDLMKVTIAAALGNPEKPVELLIQRPGVADPLTYRIKPVADPRQEGMLTLGIVPARTLTLDPDITADSWANVPWSQRGLRPGMTLRSVNGQPVTNPADLDATLTRLARTPATLSFDHADADDDSDAGSTTQLEVRAQAQLPSVADFGRHLLGLAPAAVVQEVSPGMPAEALGLQPGDVLARVGAVRFPASVGDIIEELKRTGGSPVAIDVIRDGQTLTLGQATPKAGKIGLGVAPGNPTNVVRATLPDSPAAALNLPPGSRITALNGQPITDFDQLVAELQQRVNQHAGDESLTLQLDTVLNVGEGSAESFTLTLDAEQITGIQAIGWGLPELSVFFAPDEVRVAGETVGQAAAIGLEKTGEFVQQTYITLLRLIQGSIRFENLRGPVGIVDAGVTVSSRGWPYYLFFLGLISINLAVINFLPLPIVDGGLMVFLLIEKLRGKPAGPAIQSATMIVGLVLIAGVFLIVTYHDLARLFTS